MVATCALLYLSFHERRRKVSTYKNSTGQRSLRVKGGVIILYFGVHGERAKSMIYHLRLICVSFVREQTHLRRLKMWILLRFNNTFLHVMIFSSLFWSCQSEILAPLMAAGVSSDLGAGPKGLRCGRKRFSCLFVLPSSFVHSTQRSYDGFRPVIRYSHILLLPMSLVTGNEGACGVSSCFPEGNWVVVARFWCSHCRGGVDHHCLRPEGLDEVIYHLKVCISCLFCTCSCWERRRSQEGGGQQGRAFLALE